MSTHSTTQLPVGIWQGGDVPYVIVGFDSTDRATIAKCFGVMQRVAGLKFTPGDPGSEYNMVVRAEGGGGRCRASFHFGGFGYVKAEIKLPPK